MLFSLKVASGLLLSLFQVFIEVYSAAPLHEMEIFMTCSAIISHFEPEIHLEFYMLAVLLFLYNDHKET